MLQLADALAAKHMLPLYTGCSICALLSAWLLPPPSPLPQRPPLTEAQRQRQQQRQRVPSVLLVGNPGLSLKGFDCAIATLSIVQYNQPIEVSCSVHPCCCCQGGAVLRLRTCQQAAPKEAVPAGQTFAYLGSTPRAPACLNTTQMTDRLRDPFD